MNFHLAINLLNIYKLNIEMYCSANPQVESSHNTSTRQFVLCESCFWSATIFKSTQNNVQIINSCPICSNDNISLIPLANDEAYELYVRSKGGLEIRFSKVNR
jgi:hypothetical protein